MDYIIYVCMCMYFYTSMYFIYKVIHALHMEIGKYSTEYDNDCIAHRGRRTLKMTSKSPVLQLGIRKRVVVLISALFY